MLSLLSALALLASPSDVLPFPAVEQTLPNGLKVIVVPTGFPDVVSVQVSMQVGSRNEVEPGKTGFAHFFEHMMFRGTKQNPPERYQAALTRAGARSNAFTSDDLTDYHETFTKADLEEVLALEADRFQHLDYEESVFKTESRAVLGEYNKSASQPLNKLDEVMREAAYTRHTYKHTTIGFLKDIEDMPNQYAYSREFYQRWYRPEHATVVIAGDVEPAKVLALVKKYFGPWKPGQAQTVVIPQEPAPKAPVIAHVPWPTSTPPYVALAFHGPAFSETAKDAAALSVLFRVLFSETSELYQRLVVKEQKVDQLMAEGGTSVDPELFGVYARVKRPQDALEVRDAVLKTFALARAEPVDAQRLKDAQSNLRYGFVRGLDTTEAVASRVARFATHARSYQTLNRYYATLAALTPEDLQAAARKWIVDEGLVQTTLSKEALPTGLEALPTLASVSPASAQAPVPLLTVPSKLPQLTVRMSFEAGSARDPAGKEGLAALTAAMLTQAGSRSFSYEDIVRTLNPLAASFDAQVDRELVAITGSVHRDNFQRFLDVGLPMLTQPGFREEDFRRLKDMQRAALVTDLRGNNEEELGKEVLQATVFAGTPYAHPPQGTVAGLDAITLDDVKRFASDNFSRARLAVAVAGDAGAPALAALQRALAALPAGTAAEPTVVKSTPRKGLHVTVVEKDTRAVAISLGQRVDVLRGQPDFLALSVARAWLGEHRASSGRLFQRLREVRGLNYGDYAYLEAFPRAGAQFFPETNVGRRAQLFEIWIRPVKPEAAQMAIRLALSEYRRLLERGLSAEEFEAVRGYLVKNAPLTVARSVSQAGAALDGRWFAIAPWPQYVREGLAKLTVEDVNRALKAHLNGEDLEIVAVAKDARGLAAALVADAPSKLTYDETKPQALLEEDAVLGALKLGLAADAVRVVKLDDVFAR
jgi:zinc protease